MKVNLNPVIVEAIDSARAKEGFSSVMVRQADDGQLNFTSDALGGGFVGKGLVAFHTFSDAVLEKYGIVTGCDLGEQMERNLRVKVTEILESERAKLTNNKGEYNGDLRFPRIKANPKLHLKEVATRDDGSIEYEQIGGLQQGGEWIYRRTDIIDISEDTTGDIKKISDGSVLFKEVLEEAEAQSSEAEGQLAIS